jgi:hypothetical protein
MLLKMKKNCDVQGPAGKILSQLCQEVSIPLFCTDKRDLGAANSGQINSFVIQVLEGKL